MSRAILIGAVAAALSMLVLPVGVSAQGGMGAPDHRERFVDEYDEDDFCGTGATVHVVRDLVINVWESSDAFRFIFQDKGTLTYGDATVTDHWAGRAWDLLTEGHEGDDPHTHLVTETGLRAFLKAEGSGRAVRDAGNIQFLIEFGEDHDFLGFQVAENKGPHPDITDGVYCEAAVELLGL